MKTRLVWPLALAVLLAGCGVDVVVESNTSWMGDICDAPSCASAFTNHELRGSGNKSFPQATQSGDQICYWFANATDSGYVRVYIKDNTPLGSDRNAEHKNTAPHGSVAACWTQ